MRTHITKSKEILAAKADDATKAFLVSFLIVGVILNFIFSISYGIYLSHNFAGNHYRLQQFARQIQERNLVTPLVIRKKDFFQETATELDNARKIIQNDLKEISKETNSSIIKSYELG